MAQEKNWWDGFTDSASEFASDLIGGVTSYYDSKEAQAQADRTASENATMSEQARIAEQNRRDYESAQADKQQKQQMYLFAGLAVLIVLVLLFKK